MNLERAVSGQWSVVSGQWSVVSGQWLVVGGWWLVVGKSIQEPRCQACVPHEWFGGQQRKQKPGECEDHEDFLFGGGTQW
jgi:hypothetical protein